MGEIDRRLGHLRGLSHGSTCVSPSLVSKTQTANISEVPFILKTKERQFIGQESVITSRSASGNISSGMETSKLSVFSPVLSSTIMQGGDKFGRLPQTICSDISPSQNTENSRHYGLDNLGEIEQENVDTYDAKMTPKTTIIEKVS